MQKSVGEEIFGHTSHDEASTEEMTPQNGLCNRSIPLWPVSAQMSMPHNLDIYTSYPSNADNISLGSRAGSTN